MCGIVATLGQQPALPFLLDGLYNLEYRGYDSAGLAIFDQDQIRVTKSVGQINRLADKLDSSKMVGNLGIGHTRWATHGRVLLKNTHPHADAKREFFVVHNGIIENFKTLKAFLIQHGYRFSSDTDSEVIAQLLAYNYQKTNNVRQAIIDSLQILQGAYAIVIMTKHAPEQLFGAKLSSPLVLGLADQQYYLASDQLALSKYVNQVITLQDYELVTITAKRHTITDLRGDQKQKRASELLELETESTSLDGFSDYMSQEIAYCGQTVRDVIRGRLKLKQKIIKLGGLEAIDARLKKVDNLLIVGCGSSYFAGLVGEYLFEDICRIPTQVQLGSEFRYRHKPLSSKTGMIAISQSGETADTIAALEAATKRNLLKLGLVNRPGSTVSRLTDAGVYYQAGAEKAVAATKSFIAQVTVLLLIALYLNRNYPHYSSLLQNLAHLPDTLDDFLQQNQIQALAQKYASYKNFLIGGRRYTYPIALEGALKLKEVGYIHAEGLAFGEIKHGSLALIDKNCPVLAIAPTNEVYNKVCSNLAEIKARQGQIIAIVDDLKGEAAQLADDVILIPKTVEPLQPIVTAVACYLFTYHIAKILKHPVDKPRHLAKSVTVE